jgi:hypothetical protein
VSSIMKPSAVPAPRRDGGMLAAAPLLRAPATGPASAWAFPFSSTYPNCNSHVLSEKKRWGILMVVLKFAFG